MHVKRGAAPFCLLWSIPHGATAGNVLRTGVLASVLDAVPDARVVLLSPLAADPAFTSEFAHPRVAFEVLPPHTPGGFEGRLLGVIQARYLQVCTTDTLRIRGPKEFPGAMRFRAVKRTLGRVLAPAGPGGRWYDIADRLVGDPAMDALFEQHRPTVVATASPGLSSFPRGRSIDCCCGARACVTKRSRCTDTPPTESP
jgi:hypothetical protein